MDAASILLIKEVSLLLFCFHLPLFDDPKMQGRAVALSLSFPPFSKTTNLASRSPSSDLGFNHLSFSSLSCSSLRKSLDLSPVNGASASSFARSRPLFLCSFSHFCGFSSGSTLICKRRANDFRVEAASVPESRGEIPKTDDLAQAFELGILFSLWYFFNIYFNIFNKQVLKVYPFPITVSAVQFGVATVVVLFMWTFNLYKKPKISTTQLLTILPLAMVHTLGNLFTNMSLGKVSVAFTHTIKALEPFFTVVLSALFLGEIPTLWIILSLVPIVGGVSLASLTEASFNWVGFWSAMSSNLANQSRNVFSKKIMVKKEESLDNITLFSMMTIVSFVLNVPVTLFMEGFKFTPSYLQSAGLNVRELSVLFLLSGFCFHAYQQLSYTILDKVSPVTHSVGNCVKRVVVIVASIIFFQTPVLPINAIGTGVALAGVFLYAMAKQIKPKPKIS